MRSKILHKFALICLSLTTCLAQKSFWATSGPHTPTTSDGASVNLGVRFKVLTPGTITAIKFYKGSGNTGPHTVVLWQGGTKLKSVDTTTESATGWQVVKFAAVRIQANTEYVASYFARVGHYADDQNYNWAGLRSSPLMTSSPTPGVFAYGGIVALPTESWNLSNYWVDVIFNPDLVAVPGTHSVTLSWTASTSTGVVGYKIYRSQSSGGPYSPLYSTPLNATTYVDKAITAGQTYYYVSTAIGTDNGESGYSNQAVATVPYP